MNITNMILNPSAPIQPIEPVRGFTCPPQNPFKEDIFEGFIEDKKFKDTVSFGSYQSPLKSLFKAGKLPGVKRGLYGDILTPENVSLEHIKPRSKGGKSVLANFALATRDNNSRRSSEPLSSVLTWKMLNKYLNQFNFKTDDFDGFRYKKMIIRTCAEQGVHDPYAKVKDIFNTPKKILRSLRNKAKKEEQAKTGGLDIIA